MKKFEKVLTGRCSIRRYTYDKLTDQQREFIYEAIRCTPTSYNGQQFSVISVCDQHTKEKIYEITGQKQIKTCAMFLVFCVDYHKIAIAARDKGFVAPPYSTTIDGYTVGVVDASLAMMQASVAAEALGLGSCCVGYTRTSNPALISEILGLPQGVSIVCGLSIGAPNESPDLKPKQPMPVVVHQERYANDETLSDVLKHYDEQVTHFNRERAGDKTTNDWVMHIVDYHRKEMEHSVAQYLADKLGLKGFGGK